MVGFRLCTYSTKYAKNLRDEGLEKSHYQKATYSNKIAARRPVKTREELAEQFSKKGSQDLLNCGVGITVAGQYGGD